jgi:hypothetical protein
MSRYVFPMFCDIIFTEIYFINRPTANVRSHHCVLVYTPHPYLQCASIDSRTTVIRLTTPRRLMVVVSPVSVSLISLSCARHRCWWLSGPVVSYQYPRTCEQWLAGLGAGAGSSLVVLGGAVGGQPSRPALSSRGRRAPL